jgi:hypothetical protein
MSTVEAGPKFVVGGPVPEAPRHSLLATPGVRLASAPPGVDGDRFPAAAEVLLYPSWMPDDWVECTEGTARVKGEGGDLVDPRFQSFAVYEPIGCSFRGQFQYDEMLDYAIAVLEATMSWRIERNLAHGLFGVDQPYFADGNRVDLTPSTGAVRPGLALSILDQALGTTGRVGMIHATPAIVDALGAIPVGSGEAPTVLESANGTPIVSGGGYIDPDKVFDGSADVDTVDWMYATGKVHVYVRPGAPFVPNLEETLEREDNDFVVRPERFVFAYWDNTVQYGVQVDWSA